MRALALFLALPLAACASLGGLSDPSLTRGVFTAESDFAAGLKVAIAYEALPACSAEQKFPCSDPDVEAKIKLAAETARGSLATAEAIVRSGTGGQQLATAAMRARGDVSAFAALVEGLTK